MEFQAQQCTDAFPRHYKDCTPHKINDEIVEVECQIWKLKVTSLNGFQLLGTHHNANT